MSTIRIEGNVKIVKIYNVSRVNGVEDEAYELNSRDNIVEALDSLNELVETGEAEAEGEVATINSLEADECKIAVDDQEISLDSIVLKNENIKHILADLEHFKENELFFVKTFEGKGTWDFTSDKDVKKLDAITLKYIDCAAVFDEFDILKEGYLELVCDTLLAETISLHGVDIEMDQFYLDPSQEYGELYIAKKDLISNTKVLERVSERKVLAGTDMNLDDCEEN